MIDLQEHEQRYEVAEQQHQLRRLVAQCRMNYEGARENETLVWTLVG